MFAFLRGRRGVLGLATSVHRCIVVALVPGEKFGLDAHVVVRELAHLGIVNTDNLSLFIAAETEERNKVHDPQDDGLVRRGGGEQLEYLVHAMQEKGTHGHDKGVGKAGYRVRQLNAKLSVVVIKPTTRNRRDAVSTRDAGLREKSSEYVSDDPTDGVRGEDLQFE